MSVNKSPVLSFHTSRKIVGQTFLSVKSIAFAIVVILCTSLLVGCSDVKEIVIAPEKPQEIIPLAVGNYWVYEVSHYHNPDSLIRLHTERWSVESVVYRNEATWYRILIESDEDRWRYFRNNEFGLIELRLSPESADLLYKYPVDSSEQWEIGWDYILGALSTEDVEVDAGIFTSCVHYLQSDNIVIDWQNYLESWIKPDIGIVRSKRYTNNPYMMDAYVKHELVEYHVE